MPPFDVLGGGLISLTKHCEDMECIRTEKLDFMISRCHCPLLVYNLGLG